MKKYYELAESIRMMKSQRTDIERNSMVKEQELMKLLNKMRELTVILKIFLEKQLPLYYVIKHLIQLKILNMIDSNEILLQWFLSFLVKNQIEK